MTCSLSRLFSTPLSAAALLSLTLALPLLAVTGCSDDDTGGTCQNVADCGLAEVCVGGQCVDSTNRACRGSADCGNGLTCEQGICVPAGDTGGQDMGPDAADQGGNDAQPDRNIPDQTQDPTDEEVFETAPEIVSTSPAAGETGVALAEKVTVEWDQPMDPATFTPTNLALEDWSGNAVESRRITYYPRDREVTLEPIDATGFFDSSSPYTLSVAREIRGENGMNPAARTEITFYTEPFAGQDEYQALAEAYAPVVYAEVREPPNVRDYTARIDWFTALDFDGDLDVANNMESLGIRATEVPAHIYWNVLETETHYFVQYIFYFAAAVRGDNDLWADAVDHDYAYSTVVVQKRTDDPLGAFVLAEGFGDGQVWAFALDAYPTDCGGEGQPACQGASPDLDSVWVELSADLLEPAGDGEGEPGRRYPLYLSMATHASCLMPAYVPKAFRVGNRCAHQLGDDGPFFSANEAYSRILRLGEGDNWTGNDAENIDLTYSMSPFLELWWTQRANPQIWEDSRNYTVPPEGASGDSIKLPSRLATTEESSGGTLRHAPFQVAADLGRSCGGCSKFGVWFVDPAWEVEGHASFDHDFSGAYCFNPFLGIDRRGEVGCPWLDLGPESD